MKISFWRLGWQSLMRDLRSGELRLLIVAVTLAVAALTAVGFFADRVQGGLQRDARQLLGGDAVIASDNATPAAFAARAETGEPVAKIRATPPSPSADPRAGGLAISNRRWRAQLEALKLQISRYQDLLADAMCKDFGYRPPAESKMLDLLGSTLELNHAIGHVKRWMKSSRASTEWPVPPSSAQVNPPIKSPNTIAAANATARGSKRPARRSTGSAVRSTPPPE